MFEIVFAMVTLSNSAPDAVATPSAAISSRLPGSASATGLQGLGDGSGFGNVSVDVGCSYGTPRLGPNYASDVADLTRATTTPQCADAAPMTFASPLTGPLGFVPFYHYSTSPLAAIRPPAALDLPVRDMAAATSTFTLPARTNVRILDHLKLPSEFSGGAGNLTVSTEAPARSAAARRPAAKPR